MNSIRKLSPIAIAVAALVAAPLAFAGASVSNGQTSAMNYQGSMFNATGNAVLTDNAGQNASGNIGFNIATGSQNQQANAGALSSNTNIDDAAASNANVTAGQAEILDYAWQVMNGANAVDFIGNALQGASGNIGVNMTSGIFNQQGNNMAASSAKYSDYANAGVNAGQTSMLNSNHSNLNYGYEVRGSNETGLYGNVLSNASGNIGVNEAAGISNQQSNSLAIATAANDDSEGYPIGSTANVSATQTMALDGTTQGSHYWWNWSYVNNAAGLGSNALEGASGNIGANMASGNSNQQSNNTALSATSNAKNSTTDYADATAGANQLAAGNGTMDTGVQDSATVNGNAAQNASGNIAINVVAGAQNQQENGLAMASIASPKAMGNASAPVQQVAYYNGGETVGSMYNSEVSGNALAGASGNIGLNVATGNGNQQVNTLAIASATK
ncbi:hypothetical protein [Acidithiobacillus caldus]|jgi:hypothetical protein|uniref:Large exoproteins involved in heme utilization or adhesion n=2 Tax=Acidithiobacillus TaxID=119977 RepID=A0A059ZRX6_ACICK|nr:hypothetical protein [Acidithiobacillus caldus]AIA54415.1 Large exoproteins involved in heme utilization or adhesion [Acidithiobacillus caldus ATCC 51756]MBU2729764.1 hypothetical protein [Acidithiobacillus caldus]MBU2735900.1 hypothetical protein [Acidithiobacillus caldus ATCC 51756]MBU2744669.1 hypothetical protein [Acidithiobacillus caldus]MBU2762853.1 hypothetical protein [Acidithiobacillus caldus]